MDPIVKFKHWYAQELQHTTVSIPSACCLSTVGLDGYPNSRYVSLKEIRADNFIITGPMHSRKAIEIYKNPKVSIVFWWTETEKQVRIQGIAHKIDDAMCDRYFNDRNIDSKIISLISKQGEELVNEGAFRALFAAKKSTLGNAAIARPEHWGGFAITPIRMEFMTFKASRFHLRELYTTSESGWKITKLQP